MATTTNKTVETKASVAKFLTTIKDVKKRKDSSAIIDLVTKHTGLEPKMWGTSIVGFGTCHYKYESGREGDMPLVGFSPRKNAIVFYLSGNFENRNELLQSFGKHKTGKGCIYINTLEDIDTGVLVKMVKSSIKHVKKHYPG